MSRIICTRLRTQGCKSVLMRHLTSEKKGNKSAKKSSDDINLSNVTGFSKSVLDIPSTPVGFSGCTKDSEYKNPEYFCYNKDSFADSMVELDKYRLPVPSNKAKK